MDRLAVGRTLRNWAFAATTARMNPIYDVTVLGLVSRLRVVSGFLHSSWVYMHAPILAHLTAVARRKGRAFLMEYFTVPMLVQDSDLQAGQQRSALFEVKYSLSFQCDIFLPPIIFFYGFLSPECTVCKRIGQGSKGPC